MTNRRLVGTVGAAVIVAALTGVAGCSGSLHSASGPGSGSASTGSPASSGSGSRLPTPVALNDAHGARSSLTDLHCGPDGAGSWTVTAALHNTTGKRAVYALIFDVIDAKNGSVHGRAQQQYTLDAGATTRVEVKDFYRDSAPNLTCVPNVRQAPVG